MSDVETALTGAEVAPVANAETAPATQETAPESTPEQVEAQRLEQVRDEKGRFVPQERVNEITRARREAERRVQYLEQQLASIQPPAQHQPQSSERPPSVSEYTDIDQWATAMTAYAVTQAEKNVSQRFQQNDTQRNQQRIADQFEQRSVRYAAEHPDFDRSVAELSSAVQFHPDIVEVIGVSEHGPAVVHYLAQHLDEADRISRLPPHIAAVQLGRIEAQVAAPKPKPVTNAPPPAPVLGGGSAVQKDPERMPVDEWLAWRRAQLKAK